MRDISPSHNILKWFKRSLWSLVCSLFLIVISWLVEGRILNKYFPPPEESMSKRIVTSSKNANRSFEEEKTLSKTKQQSRRTNKVAPVSIKTRRTSTQPNKTIAKVRSTKTESQSKKVTSDATTQKNVSGKLRSYKLPPADF